MDDRSVESARGELRLRVYRPRERSETGSAQNAARADEGPGLVFFHGGGFVAGDVASHDAFCARLSAASGCVIVSCSYRLAPEHRFPAAIDDAYFAACFVHEHADEFGIDHRRLGIAGIEVGASLATGVARLAKERRNPALVFQLLVQPILDFSLAALSGAPAIGPASLEWAVAQYIDPALREDPRCSPLRATNLIGLPSTFLLCGDQSVPTLHAERYEARLRDAHVPVTVAQAADAAACAKALVQALS